MQFHDTSTSLGLVQDAWYKIFGDSGDHTADYPLADLARNANKWLDKAAALIMSADSTFDWDDTNQTDLPIANIDLVASQQDYGISAATFLKIKKAEIKDANGDGIDLTPISLDELRGVAEAEFQKTAGTPKYYRPLGSSAFLYPKPNYSYTNGLRIFYQRNVVYFTAGSTSTKPGFAEPFHEYISAGMAWDYAFANSLESKKRDLKEVQNEIALAMIDFYAKRHDVKQSLSLKREDYGQLGLSGTGRRVNHSDKFYA